MVLNITETNQRGKGTNVKTHKVIQKCVKQYTAAQTSLKRFEESRRYEDDMRMGYKGREQCQNNTQDRNEDDRRLAIVLKASTIFQRSL